MNDLLVNLATFFKSDDEKVIFEIVAESLILELDKILKLNANAKSDAQIYGKKKMALTVLLNDQSEPSIKSSNEKDLVIFNFF